LISEYENSKSVDFDNGSCVALFASWSAISFSMIPECEGTHIKRTSSIPQKRKNNAKD